MKKVLLLLTVCTVSVHLSAQTTKAEKVPPPPPPPPAVAEIPPPPPPPPAPPQDVVEEMKFTPPVIVNEEGYSLSVHRNNGNEMVYVKKNGVSEKIPLSKWNANKAFYEKKYGKLPPPPPPPPAPPAPPKKPSAPKLPTGEE